MRSRSPARRSRVITALAVVGATRRLDGPGVRRRHPKRRRQCRATPASRRRAAPLPGRASAGAAAGRGPARPDDAGREDRPDDPGRRGGGRRRPAADRQLAARLAAVRRRLGADAQHPAGWADMVDGFQARRWPRRCGIPIIYGVDAVHGHNNVVGATIFPHNIGLGATRDPALVERIGRATAEEVRATGIDWDFAPCLCVARNDRWGRTYESFGEDPALVDADGDHRSPACRAARQLDDPAGAGHRQALRRRRRHHQRHRRPAGSYRSTRATRSHRRPTSRGSTSPPFLAAVQRARRRLRDVSYSARLETASATRQDARQQLPDHRRAQGRAGLRRLRRLATGTASTRSTARAGFTADEVRAGVNAGIDMVMVPNDCAAVHHRCCGRGAGRPGHDGPHRRREPPHPDQEVRARPVRAAARRPDVHRPRSAAPRTGRWPARRSPSRRCC